MEVSGARLFQNYKTKTSAAYRQKTPGRTNRGSPFWGALYGGVRNPALPCRRGSGGLYGFLFRRKHEVNGDA